MGTIKEKVKKGKKSKTETKDAYIRELVVLKNATKYKKQRLPKRNYCYIGHSIHFPYAVADIFKGIKDETVKKFFVMHLDTKHRLVSFQQISTGTLNNSVVNKNKIFSGALIAKVKDIILVSNHPSGDPTPSDEERELTIELRKAGEPVGIDVGDHIILGREAYYSVFEEMKRRYRIHESKQSKKRRSYVVEVCSKEEWENLYGIKCPSDSDLNPEPPEGMPERRKVTFVYES